MTVEEEIRQAATFFLRKAWESGDFPGSVIAGIYKPHGLDRIVVGPFDGMQGHLATDEKLVILPEIVVAEPISWGSLPNIVNLVERYVKEGKS